MLAAFREDSWLGGVLERPCFAVQGAADLPAHDGVAFLYAKVEVADVARVAELTEQGFFVVDVNVLLRYEGPMPHVSAEGIVVRAACPESLDALLDIAETSFTTSRFHLDPLIPNELADCVKREWVRSYAEGRRGIELLEAAADGGLPVGFLAVLETPEARVIDLIGVAPAARGRGVGSALVAGFVERHFGRASELLVGTQVANYSSLRLYARLGFVVVGAKYVLHLHRP